MSEITVATEHDPVPIVKIIAAQFERSAHHPAFVRLARNFTGTFALASKNDPQAVTVEAKKGNFHVKRGVADNAAITIRLNFNNLDEAPSVENLWRHPLLALKVGKLMETFETSWIDAGKRFWEAAADRPYMPRAVRLHCTDDDRHFDLGEGEPEVVLEGTAKNLIELLTGGNIAVVCVMEGKIKVSGSMQHLTTLSEATKDMMLGKL